MYIGHQTVAVDSVIISVSSLTIPAGATHAEVSTTSDIFYTLDGTNPTVIAGLYLNLYKNIILLPIEDLRNIKMIKGAIAVARVGIHYIAGRNI